MQDIIDDIYEAAFVPERWPSVLQRLAEASRSASGGLIVFTGGPQPRIAATDLVREALAKFTAADGWRKSDVVSYTRNLPPACFLYDADYFPPEVLRANVVRTALTIPLGLGGQVGSLIAMPTGEQALFAFDRWASDDRPRPRDIDFLNGLRPHLARAGLLAARLGLERAQTMVATLGAIGLPAAVLDGKGRALATNASLDKLAGTVLPAAHGRLAIAAGAANTLFQEAVLDLPREQGPAVRSIPVPERPGRSALVLHLVPVRGAAHDVFSGASTLLVATTVGMSENIPGADLLRGLFDLSPREAALATTLAAGRSLKAAAEGGGITFSTARSYLESIFRKTGTNQQSQLVALLKSAGPIAAGRE